MMQMRTVACWCVLLFGVAAAVDAQSVVQVGPGAHPSIASAVAAARDGDVIRIAPGVWPGDWTMRNLSLRFVADGPGVIVSVPLVSSCDLRPTDRVQFVGIAFATPTFRGVVSVNGGTGTFEDCTLGIAVHGRSAAMHFRHCTGGDVILNDCDSTISSSTHSGRVQVGGGTLQVSSSSLTGSGGAAIHVFRRHESLWIVDSQVTGANSGIGTGWPAVEAALTTGIVRVHRSTLAGGQGPAGQGPPVSPGLTLQPGPLLGVDSQPAAVTPGGALQTTFRGEPGDLVFVLGGFAVGGAAAVPGLEQKAFGFAPVHVLGILVGDPTGAAQLTLAVPNNPTLQNLAVFLRGLNLSRSPWQASAVVPVLVR